MTVRQKSHWLRRLPIRRKLLLITMATSFAAMLPTLAGFTAFVLVREREALRSNAVAIAQMIAANTTGALTFDDMGAAEGTLASLVEQDNVLAGCLYRESELFAAYRRTVQESCPPNPGDDGAEFVESVLRIVEPVMVGGQRAGTIYLETSLQPVYAMLRDSVVVIPLLFAISGIAAFWFSSRLQRVISVPVLNLAATARNISERQDYSLRAIRETEDELDTMVRAFNQMLDQIQHRDAELLDAKANLERRVAERTEELEARNSELALINRDLDDFVHIASHDLKEPLRGIHNYCTFLNEDYGDVLDDEGRRRLATLSRLSRRMEAIIDSLLRYSRIRREAPSIQAVDLGAVLSEVSESLEHSMEEKGTELRVPRPLPTVACDPAGAAEIFRNLLSNAIKYNRSSEQWVEVSWFDDGGHPTFYVRDNGIGIPKRHHGAVFRIFKRLHARDRYGGGTGAGLTIVKTLVERHNGRIWVDSAPGEGTTFYFTLSGEPAGRNEKANPAHLAR